MNDLSLGLMMGHTSSEVPTMQEMSAFYQEISELLERVERAVTHYHVLGVERSASTEAIKEAYTSLMRLHPARYQFRIEEPEHSRVEHAFERIAQALAVLSNFGKRVAYDNSLRQRTTSPLARIDIPSPARPGGGDAAPCKPAHIEPSAPVVAEHVKHPTNAQGTTFSDHAHGDNRRRAPRLSMKLPARVTGFDRSEGRWTEMAHTVNASRSGVALTLGRRVEPGIILHLLAPLPVKLRGHGYVDQGYSVFAIVRRAEPPKDGVRLVGLEFFGEHPPAGYKEKPWRAFLTTEWAERSRRREPRVERAEPFGITYLDESRNPVGEDFGLTENVSPSGARVRLRAKAPDVDLINVLGMGQPFETRAVIRGRYVGKDGGERLCVQFLDAFFPV